MQLGSFFYFQIWKLLTHCPIALYVCAVSWSDVLPIRSSVNLLCQETHKIPLKFKLGRKYWRVPQRGLTFLQQKKKKICHSNIFSIYSKDLLISFTVFFIEKDDAQSLESRVWVSLIIVTLFSSRWLVFYEPLADCILLWHPNQLT